MIERVANAGRPSSTERTARRFALPHYPDLGASIDLIERSSFESEDTLVVALTFRCNSRCRFCFVEEEIEAELPDLDRAVVERVCLENARSGRFSRLTLTGAEVTLLPDLAQLARLATTTGRFECVRIQTNGRRLKDDALVDALMQAGVNEYFVSIHAHQPDLDAKITRSPVSFREMRQGLANLRRRSAHVISNTVVCADNHVALPEIADFLLAEGVREAHLWNFLEIGDVGQSHQFAPLREAAPRVVQAARRLLEGGADVVLKWFPRCLLGPYGARLDNFQPQTLIRDEFQLRLSRNLDFGCVHERSCRHFGDGCDGLHGRYRAVMGEEQDLLQPEPVAP